jgi:ribosomal protein L34
MVVGGFIPGYVFLAGIVGVAATVYVFLSGFIWGAGWQPMPRKACAKVCEVVKRAGATTVYDLGAGFGRVALRVASSTGAECVAVEVDPVKALWVGFMARMMTRDGEGSVAGRVRVVRSNLFDVDVSGADAVVLFLWPGVMGRVGEKLRSEMKRGCIVISYDYPIPGWEPEAVYREVKLYVYRVPGASN